jgi:bifunctional non-homologous end joining protein LigD
MMAVNGKAAAISNPGRMIYANHRFTKQDLIDYYEGIARYLLPHLKNRPVTLKRYPEETTGPSFYEKDAPAFTPKWVRTFSVPRRGSSGDIQYIIIADRRTLVWAASVGTIEIHPFLAKAPDLEQPTSAVFDLDPGEGVNIIACARVALRLRDLLQQLGLRSFAKVSGSRGIQVYVPLNTGISYAATQPFAQAVAQWLHREHPKEIVAEMTRAERKGKVFIDWSQNADYKTTVGVYSLRAKLHRPFASLPVSWEELSAAIEANNSSQLYWLAQAAIDRVRNVADLFAPVLKLKQSLPEAFAAQVATRAKPLRTRHITSTARASEQGGRRSFLLVSRPHRVELRITTQDEVKAWVIHDALPAPGRSAKITLQKASSGAPGSTVDSGTAELVEGSERKGWMHWFFTGKKLAGDCVLTRSSGAEWRLARLADFPELPS